MPQKNRNHYRIQLKDSWYTVPIWAARFEVNGYGQIIFYDAYDSIVSIFDKRFASQVEEGDTNRILWIDGIKLIDKAKVEA